jgi:hypothetical protein
MAKSRKHPRQGDVYTPVTPELVALLERMHDELGSWRAVCFAADIRPKILRSVRNSRSKSVSFSWLDDLCTCTGVGSVDEFQWFTPDDLVALGIWKPTQYVHGKKRIKGDKVWVTRTVQEQKKAKKWKGKPKPVPQGNEFFTSSGRPTKEFEKEQLERRRDIK